MSFFGDFFAWISSSNKRVRGRPGFDKDKFIPWPPTNFSYEILPRSNNMRKAIVKFTWTPSVSPDVLKQVLNVNVDGVDDVSEFTPFVNEHTVDINEAATVHAELHAHDGTNDSDPVVLDFSIGDLTAPLSPTGFAFEIVDVIDG